MVKVRELCNRAKFKLMRPVIGASTALMLAAPAFAAGEDASATIDPTAFDGLSAGVTGNLNAILPKVVVLVGMLIGIGVVIGLVRKHAKPA